MALPSMFVGLLVPALLTVLALALLVLVYNLLYRLLPSARNHPRLDLSGKTVLLTGASSGIGREMARVMHAKGAKLILAARSTDQLEKLCAELNEEEQPQALAKKGRPQQLHKARFCRLDLEELANDKQKLDKFVDELKEMLPPSSTAVADNGKFSLDVLVNNAGQMAYGRGRHTDMTVLRQIMDVNYLGTVALTQALMDSIPDRGAIVLLGSIAGRVALPYMGAYCAAKHAVQAFFDSLRAEDRPLLHILTVSAGYVNTDLGPRALNEQGRAVGKPDPGQLGGISAEEAAQEVVAALERRETDLLLAPFLPRFLLSLRLATPNLMWYFLHRNLRGIYGNVGRMGTE